MLKKKSVVSCVAGKSGGHIIPALSVARQEYPQDEVIFFSTATTLDKKILNDCTIAASFFFPLSDFPRKKFWQYPLFTIQFLYAFFSSFIRLIQWQPRVVISMGGYISIPIVLSALILRIPIKVYELNARPGLAVKLLSFFTKNIYYCFDKTDKFLPKSANRIQYPLRYLEKDIIDSSFARQKLGLIVDKPTILILGGSQGSRFINNLIMNFIKQHKEHALRYSIIHQTGKTDEKFMQNFYIDQGLHAYVFSFRRHMADLYCAADIVITRAGAGSLFEIAFFHKPALIIPLQVGTTSHQLDNAQAMRASCTQLFDVLQQKDIQEDPQLFSSWLMRIDR